MRRAAEMLRLALILVLAAGCAVHTTNVRRAARRVARRTREGVELVMATTLRPLAAIGTNAVESWWSWCERHRLTTPSGLDFPLVSCLMGAGDVGEPSPLL